MTNLETLNDTFSGTSLNAAKWENFSSSGRSPVVGGGILTLDSGGSGAYTGIITANNAATSNFAIAATSLVHAKVDCTKIVGAGYFNLKVSCWTDPNDSALMQMSAGSINCGTFTDGTWALGASVPYDPVAHAWWRIRFGAPSGNNVTIFFDVSADGVTWTQISGPQTKLWSYLGARVEMQCFYGGTSGPASIATVDNINIKADGVTPYAKPISGLRDEFMGSTLNPDVWTTVNSDNGSVTVSGGYANFQLTNSAVGEMAMLQTVAADYVMSNDAVYVKLTPCRKTNTNTEYVITNPATGRVARFTVNGASTMILNAQNDAGTNAVNTGVTWDAYTWAYMRIRMAGTQVFFDRSSDGVTWTQHIVGNSVTWGGAVRFHIRLGISNQTNSPPHTAQLDAVNMLGGAQEIAPTSLNNPETLDAPAVTQPPTDAAPAGIADTETVGSPAAAADLSAQPDGVTDPETLAVPAVGQAQSAEPQSLGDPETVGVPDLNSPASPDSLSDPETFGVPVLENLQPPAEPDTLGDEEHLGDPLAEMLFLPLEPATIVEPEGIAEPTSLIDFDPSHPDGIGDPETVGVPASLYTRTVNPDSIADPETVDGVDAGMGNASPDNIADADLLGVPGIFDYRPVFLEEIGDPETVGTPNVFFVAPAPLPDSLADGETVGLPQLSFTPGTINPAGIADPQALDGPASSFISVYNGGYSTGTYGVGPYQGMSFVPLGIVDFGVVAEPDIYSVPPIPTTIVLPDSIIDGETLDGPSLPRQNASNWLYGAGTYTEGIYYGDGGTPTDENPADNVTYSTGTYGYGIYYGIAQSATHDEALPLFPDVSRRVQPALHVLGIGPWSSAINWRGAPNYGVRAGTYPARPAMALPPATSKGFTLRLGDGGEARFDLAFPRGSAIIVDEMDTDLWWRRKDPRTGLLEMIGRFNVAHLQVATSDTGVSCNVQLVDYRTVLGERMVLKYRDRVNSESSWDDGTPIIDIIEWALPTNTGLDLSEAVGGGSFDLGKSLYPFTLPPGTTIADLMDNLNAISEKSWEWWVETPLDISKPPKLRFVIGEQGTDRGVTLFDVGSGPTPIASWTRNGATDDYANAIYYTGGGTGIGKDAGGGVVELFDAQVSQYGQRDVLDGNSTIRGGDVKVLRQRATRKLEKYADRRPSYTVKLRYGFWRGLGHINIGDTVTLILRLGDELLQDRYRVSELSVDIDDNGAEDVTLNLGRLPTSADPRSKRSPIARVVRYLKNYSAPDGSADIPPRDDD